MTIQQEAEHLIMEKEIESLTRDIIKLTDEVQGLHMELSQIRSAIANLDRNGYFNLKEPAP